MPDTTTTTTGTASAPTATPAEPTAPQPAAAPPSGTPTVTPTEPAKPADSPMDTDAGRRALAAERQRAADEKKRADDLDARLKLIEDKDKTDLERATSTLAELQEKYANSEAQRLRLQVATAHSIGPDDLVLLTATTEDDLNVQAARIAALNAATRAAQSTPPFVPNPGQHAGNGTPVAPKATVAAGRDLFRQRHPARSGN